MTCNAGASGAEFGRIDGYVFRTQRPGTVPLKNYWSRINDYSANRKASVHGEPRIHAMSQWQWQMMQGNCF